VLNSLIIENIVLIDKAEINFFDGLCILSGETGSGKSILLDALGLAIGSRTNLRLIGSSSNKAQVIAEFNITNNQACKDFLIKNDLVSDDHPDILRIRRIIQENSNHKIYINDILVGATLLSNIGETLVEIHGQHDQKGLLNNSFHGAILDEYANSYEFLQEIAALYKQLKAIDSKIAEMAAKKDYLIKEKDYLLHIIQELKSADLKENEESELVKKKDLIIARQKISEFINNLKANFFAANNNLIQAQKYLIKNQNIINNYLPDNQAKFEEIHNKIDEQNINIDENINYLEDLQRNITSGYESEEEITERLFLLRALARKLNAAVSDLPSILIELIEKLKLLENEEIFSEKIIRQKRKLLSVYKLLAEKLSQKRIKAALDLAKKVEEELCFLKMQNVKFKVDIAKNAEMLANNPDYYGLQGFDKIKFIAAINSDKFDDLSKTASGGELSRFMLALKVALINIKSVPVVVFDEVDAGIGGAVADMVGKRLKILAQKLQVFAVTHHPQIAAKSNQHFRISKIKEGSKVKTIVCELDKTEKITEIARMLSGQTITKEALAAAEALIE
jgi:DNA repair protein RecN (Recombination protein N)